MLLFQWRKSFCQIFLVRWRERKQRRQQSLSR
jgi:hypothetical protein